VPHLAGTGAAKKKKTLHATERDTAKACRARQQYRRQIGRWPVKKLKLPG
jgi:hypothetical protein